MPFIARYNSECPLCEARIARGDRADKWCGETVHPACKKAEQDAQAVAKTIPVPRAETPAELARIRGYQRWKDHKEDSQDVPK